MVCWIGPNFKGGKTPCFRPQGFPSSEGNFLPMIVRAYGFLVDASVLPPAMPIDSAFVGLRDHGVGPLDKKETVHGTATLVKHSFRNVEQDWWAGIVLRARDAKSFSKLVKADGKLHMTAEELKDGKIAESSYFLAHPTSGRGLIATYWGSPGVPAVTWALKKAFAARQTLLRQAATAEVTGIKEKAKVALDYRGALKIIPQIREGRLSDYLKDLKRTHSADIKIGAVEEANRMFRAVPPKSVTRTEHYVFPPDFTFTQEMALAAELELAENEGMEATFTGINARGHPETISSVDMKNKLVFGSTEYDELHGDFFAFNHDEAGSNIGDSPVINWLKRILNHATIHQNLVVPQ